jgi:hypothetical protein
MTKTRVKLLETCRTRMFHHVTPPEVSSLLRPYFSLRFAASFVARPDLKDVSNYCELISKRQDLLYIGSKQARNVIEGYSVSPVWDIVYTLAVLNS